MIRLKSSLGKCNVPIINTYVLGIISMLAVSAATDTHKNIVNIYKLQTYLLTGNSLSTKSTAAADIDRNGVLNAVDLTLLKRAALQPYPLFINEVCSSNHASYLAADGGSPDWIELYHAGDTPLDLSGFGLTDKASNPYRFVFPAGTVIPANGYLLVLCDAASENGAELHAPFKLSASGETVSLYAPKNTDGTAGMLLDTVTVPALNTDIAYGRQPDGTGAWTRMTPSAGMSNAESQIDLDAPVFSRAGGFYDAAFDLTLSSPAGCRILYSTDGSDPRTSDTANVYGGTIAVYDNTDEPNHASAYGNVSSVTDFVPSDPVDKGIIVRAVSTDADGNYSKVVTNGYYIGKTASYYKSLRVISIATDPANLFNADTGIYLQKNCMNRGKEWERPVHIQVYENGISRYSADVGMRMAGNWSRNYPQKSMTFYARSEYGASKMQYDFFGGAARDCKGKKITEFDKVTLRNGGDGYDNARFRDDLNAYLADGLALGIQAKYDYVVFLDGEFWGCYSMQEKLDDEYLESHYHVEKENITTIKNTLGEGDDGIYQDYLAFYDWAKDADMQNPENYRQFCGKMDVQSFIDFIVAESCVCNWDSLINVNNTMIWRANQPDAANPYADGKWRFLFFDTEYSSGFMHMSADYDYLSQMDKSGAPNSFGTLFYNLIQNAEFASQFRASYTKALQQNFTAERASAKIDAYTESLSAVYLATAARFGFALDPAAQAEIVRDFWKQRGAYAEAQYEKQIANAIG